MIVLGSGTGAMVTLPLAVSLLMPGTARFQSIVPERLGVALTSKIPSAGPNVFSKNHLATSMVLLLRFQPEGEAWETSGFNVFSHDRPVQQLEG